MKKKLLLTTAFASIFASLSASAIDYLVTYNGNNNYTLEGVNYTSLTSLGNAVQSNYNNGTFLPEDEVEWGEGSGRSFLSDLFTNPIIRNQAPSALANIFGDNENEMRVQLDSLYNLTSSYSPQQLLELRNYIYSGVSDGVPTSDALIRAFENSQFYITETVAVANNPTLQARIISRNALANITDRTPEQEANFIDDNEQINSAPEFIEFRDSPTTQESLKDRIKQIKELEQAFSTNNLPATNTDREEKLQYLKENLSKYLVLDVKDANAVPAVQKSDSPTSEALLNSLITSTGVIDSRLGGFSGVSSGELFQAYGVWVQGNMSQSIQKAHKNASGYKSNEKGFTVGGDVGDEYVVGAAYSFSDNDIKDKSNSATKNAIKSHLFSLYGKAAINEQFFASSQVQFGKSDIKKQRATGDAANNIARAKTKADSLALKFIIGSEVEVAPQTYLVPSIGVSYANIDVKGYKENGNGLNRTVGKRTSNRTSGLLGLGAKYISETETMKIIPEVHVNLDYAFKTKNSATLVTLVNGINPISTPSEKLSKALCNVGGSVKAISMGMYEISAGYDFGVAKKFQSHTGTIKLKINL